MARKVIWADSAIADLDTAAEYISNDSPAYSAAFVLRTLEADYYIIKIHSFVPSN